MKCLLAFTLAFFNNLVREESLLSACTITTFTTTTTEAFNGKKSGSLLQVANYSPILDGVPRVGIGREILDFLIISHGKSRLVLVSKIFGVKSLDISRSTFF